MRKRQRESILDLHSARELGRRFALVQLKAAQAFGIGLRIPAGIKAARHRGDVGKPAIAVLVHSALNKAELLPHAPLLCRMRRSEKADLPGVRMHKSEDGPESGRFAGSVAADQPCDASPVK